MTFYRTYGDKKYRQSTTKGSCAVLRRAAVHWLKYPTGARMLESTASISSGCDAAPPPPTHPSLQCTFTSCRGGGLSTFTEQSFLDN